MGDCREGKNDTAPYVEGRPTEVRRARTLAALFDEMRCCTRCSLASERTRVVRGVGPSPATLMLIGEAPGAQEDVRGEPFVGRGGRLLDRLLEEAGIDRADAFVTNVVACRPPGNRAPRVPEVRAHAPWLDEQIRLVQPAVVCTLGRTALSVFDPKGKVTRVHGQARGIERRGREILLLPTFHPAAALRSRRLLPEMQADFATLAGLLASRR